MTQRDATLFLVATRSGPLDYNTLFLHTTLSKGLNKELASKNDVTPT